VAHNSLCQSRSRQSVAPLRGLLVGESCGHGRNKFKELRLSRCCRLA
jgi:hypothetical protein